MTTTQTHKDAKGSKPTKKANKKSKSKVAKVEGEGSYEATRRYDEGVAATIESGRVDELARAAKRAIESPEGEALTRAEEEGKKPRLPQ